MWWSKNQGYRESSALMSRTPLTVVRLDQLLDEVQAQAGAAVAAGGAHVNLTRGAMGSATVIKGQREPTTCSKLTCSKAPKICPNLSRGMPSPVSCTSRKTCLPSLQIPPLMVMDP